MADLAANGGIDEVAAVITKCSKAAAGKAMLEVGAGDKAAAPAGSSIEPAVAAASGVELAPSEEDTPKPKPKPKRKSKVKDKPEPTVISIGIERLEEDYIKKLRTQRTRRLRPLSEDFCKAFPRTAAAYPTVVAITNKKVDLEEDILRQYDKKGYALVRVEHLDNGRKKWFRLPEEETA